MSIDRCACGKRIDTDTAEQEYVDGELVMACAACVQDPPHRCVECGAGGECLPGCPSRLAT